MAAFSWPERLLLTAPRLVAIRCGEDFATKAAPLHGDDATSKADRAIVVFMRFVK